MVRKRRQRSRNRKPRQAQPVADYEGTVDHHKNAEDSEYRWQPKIVAAELVPEDSDEFQPFRPAGYVCAVCGWRTTKTKTPGKQALRAHKKVHARDRRAVRRATRNWLVGLSLILATLPASLLNPVNFTGLTVYSPIPYGNDFVVGVVGLILFFMMVRMAAEAKRHRSNRTARLGQLTGWTILAATALHPLAWWELLNADVGLAGYSVLWFLAVHSVVYQRRLALNVVRNRRRSRVVPGAIEMSKARSQEDEDAYDDWVNRTIGQLSRFFGLPSDLPSPKRAVAKWYPERIIARQERLIRKEEENRAEKIRLKRRSDGVRRSHH